MTIHRSISSALTALLLAACGAAGESAPDTESASNENIPARGETGPEPSGPAAACQFDPSRVDITAENTDDGAAIVFTPKQGAASVIQGDVESFQRTLPGQLPAEQRSAEADLPPHENEEAGTGMTNQQAGVDTEQVAITTRTEVTDGRVRVLLTPRDPLHLQMVRDYARRHAETLAGADCGQPTAE